MISHGLVNLTMPFEDWWVALFLAAAYAQRGDTAKAAAAKAEVLPAPGVPPNVRREQRTPAWR
jgi:hypothetical protein